LYTWSIGINKENVVLRTATIHDAKILREWDDKPHVRESGIDEDWVWETELLHEPEWRQQLMAEAGGRPIGFIQIIDPREEETHYWGDVEPNLRAIDIWIGEEEYIGKGYGTEMMNQALELCFGNPDVKAVLIDPLESNKIAIKFYLKIGFEFLEKRTFDEDKCLVLRLSRERWGSIT
jgi:aminoglycoside 6'-N-acetyltransferase